MSDDQKPDLTRDAIRRPDTGVPHMLRIVFLDMDGVLNNWESCTLGFQPMPWCVEHGAFNHPLAPGPVDALNKIYAETGAVAVMSSTWRLGSEDYFVATIQHLYHYGVVMPIVSRTPSLIGRGLPRGGEIDRWLHEHKGVCESFVILDDDDDMKPHMDRLVLTNHVVGLTTENAEKAIELLCPVEEA